MKTIKNNGALIVVISSTNHNKAHYKPQLTTNYLSLSFVAMLLFGTDSLKNAPFSALANTTPGQLAAHPPPSHK